MGEGKGERERGQEYGLIHHGYTHPQSNSNGLKYQSPSISSSFCPHCTLPPFTFWTFTSTFIHAYMFLCLEFESSSNAHVCSLFPLWWLYHLFFYCSRIQRFQTAIPDSFSHKAQNKTTMSNVIFYRYYPLALSLFPCLFSPIVSSAQCLFCLLLCYSLRNHGNFLWIYHLLSIPMPHNTPLPHYYYAT